MTATMKPEARERVKESEPVHYGSLADLQRQPKRAELTWEGKVYLFRELKSGEIESISLATVKEEVDADGKEVRKHDFKGNRARWIAHAWINPDGTQVLKNPMAEYVVINEFFRDVVDAMFEVVDKLNGLTKESRDALGKGSGQTATTGGL